MPGRGRLNIPPDICALSWHKGGGPKPCFAGTLPNLGLKFAHDNSNRPFRTLSHRPHPYRQRAGGAFQSSLRVAAPWKIRASFR